MTQLLHIDASARPGLAGIDPHGSHTRRLTHEFIRRWQGLRPDDPVRYRDVGAHPPAPVDAAWVEAEFTPADARTPAMDAAIADSNALVEELIEADLLVLGVPLYNFSMPSSFKAWIDSIVRLGRTCDFQPENPPLERYVPLLVEKPRSVVLLSSRGGHGLDPGGPFAHMNHLEASVRTAFEFIGITDLHTLAIEHQEDGGDLLDASVRQTLASTLALADTLAAQQPPGQSQAAKAD